MLEKKNLVFWLGGQLPLVLPAMYVPVFKNIFSFFEVYHITLKICSWVSLGTFRSSINDDNKNNN